MSTMLFLVIGTPFVAAFLSYLIGRKNLSDRNFFALATCGITLAFSLALFLHPSDYTTHTRLVLGLHFTTDHFRSLYGVILSFMWTVTGAFSLEYFAEHYRNRNRYCFFLLLTLSSALGVFFSADLMTAFVFFELLSLTSFVWVIHDETPGADRAAKTYLAVAVIGGLVLFMGLCLLQQLLGTLTIAELLPAARRLSDQKQLYVPGLCILFGFGAKAGMFPLHIWLPKAHPVAPAPASALLSGALTKIGIFGILAISATLFYGDRAWGNMLLFLALLTMFTGALLAIFSVDLKRTLACSSMSQIGFILLGVALTAVLGKENSLAATGTIDYMMNHSMLKLSLFMGAGAVYMNLHKLNLNDIRGFGRRKPILCTVFLFGALGLSGMPLFCGFLGKTMLHEALLEYRTLTGSRLLSVAEWVFMLSGGMTLAYMTKLFVCLFLDPPTKESHSTQKRHYINPLSELVLLLSALLIPVLGLPPVMKALIGKAVSFAGAREGHYGDFLSWEALQASLITLLIGACIYFLFIRRFLMRKGEYLDRWNPKLDLENSLYRPLLTGLLPAVLGALARVFALLPDRIFCLLPKLGGAAGTLIDRLPDHILRLLRHTAFRQVKAHNQIHAADPLAESAGHLADRITHTNSHVLRFGRLNRSILEDLREVGSGFSFALLLTSVGLVITLVALLLF